MNIEEKPYLQDLFNHMSNEHGLILTQSEMLEILSVCGKEYDMVQFEIGETERQNRMLSAENEKLREALRDMCYIQMKCKMQKLISIII